MKRISIATIGVLISATSSVYAAGFVAPPPGTPSIPGAEWSADDMMQGVICEIKNISLHAKSAADCTKAGGKMTSVVKPAAPKK